jgi:hypothetical protein
MKLYHVAVATLVALLASSSAPADNPTMVQFRIEVRTDPDGLSLKCTSGCAWKTLTVGCTSNEPCTFVLDQNGMGQ